MSAHGKTHWIKLYVEMLDDPKVGLLPDAVKWRWVSVLLQAGELNEDGFLPDVNDMAWRLHTNVETLQGEMRTLAGRGLAELRTYTDGSERWFIPAFEKRQAAANSTERSRMSRHRARQNSTSNEDETDVQRNVAKTLHKQNTETETETETEEEARATPPQNNDPIHLLQDHFTNRKAIYANDHSGTYDRDWQQPLTAVLKRAGGNVDRAKSLIDAALDVAAGHNETGKTYTVSSPRSLSGIIANLPDDRQPEGVSPDSLWQKTLACLSANKAPDEPRLLAAVKDVGWETLCAADEYSTPRLKSKLFNAYRSAPT